MLATVSDDFGSKECAKEIGAVKKNWRVKAGNEGVKRTKPRGDLTEKAHRRIKLSIGKRTRRRAQRFSRPLELKRNVDEREKEGGQ